MRIHIKFSPNKDLVPYNYQEKLVSFFHQALGNNLLHDALSLYSLSWLSGGRGTSEGLGFPKGAQWFLSAHDVTILKQVVSYAQENPEWYYGMSIQSIDIQDTPNFDREQYFRVSSPVFIKRNIEIEKRIKFYTYEDEQSDILLTETLQSKLKIASLNSEGVSVRFDTTYNKAFIKNTVYKGVTNRASYCPVIVKGTPEQIAFAWNVGVGNSTGIGFGSLI